MAKKTPQQRALEAGAIFTPAVPVSEEALFAGRLKEIRRVVDVINQRGAHAVVYGERGVGKTSLANVIATKLSNPVKPILSPRINCDSTDTFTTLWKKIFSEVDLHKKRRHAPGYQATIYEETVAAASVVGNNITPDDVRRLLTLLGEEKTVILIFDEFDRIADSQCRHAMADTVKALSDHDAPATIVIVGVADNVGELIAEHQSIDRNIEQIKMPRMSRADINEIVSKGVARLQMRVTAQAQLRVALLSQGLPHYAHLLALNAVRTAIDTGSEVVEVKHVNEAIGKAFAGSNYSLRNDLLKAITSPQSGNIYSQVLLACAMAQADEFGFFYPADVEAPLTRIMKKAYKTPSFVRHLSDFCTPERGPVLQRIGEKRKWRYRFANPLLQPLIIMKGIVDKRITEETLDEPVGKDGKAVTPAP